MIHDLTQEEIIELRSQKRKDAIEKRKKLGFTERKEKSASISELLYGTEEFSNSRTVMIYKATEYEVCLDELERISMENGDGKIFLYPLCVSDSEMTAHSPRDGSAWQRGYKGIMEPDPDRSLRFLPEEIDLVVCPCAAFDEKLGRMGMGGGFYDRFLEKCINAKVIAVAFEIQRTEDVFALDWDVPMQAVITESRIYR